MLFAVSGARHRRQLSGIQSWTSGSYLPGAPFRPRYAVTTRVLAFVHHAAIDHVELVTGELAEGGLVEGELLGLVGILHDRAFR